MKLKIFRGFISVVFVSFALFGGSHPPATPPKPLENLVVKILQGMLSCDDKPSSNPSSPSNPTPSTDSSVDDRTQLKDAIQSQDVKGDKSIAGAIAAEKKLQFLQNIAQGDANELMGNVEGAIDCYKKALLFANTNTDAGRDDTSYVYTKIGLANFKLGAINKKWKDPAPYYKESADAWETGGNIAASPLYKARSWAAAAMAYHELKSNKDCELLNKAQQICPAKDSNNTYEKISEKRLFYGCIK